MEEPGGVTAQDRGLGRLRKTSLANDSQWLGIAQPERVIAAEQHAIRSRHADEVRERGGELHERVVVEAAQIGARQRCAVAPRLGPRRVAAVEAADVIRQEATTVDQHDVERGKSVERAAQDQAAGGQGRLERIADEVVQVVTAEALDGFEEERML